MFNFPSLRGLSLFTNLTSLSIMQQSLERIEGLEACAQLQHLWVVECRVRKIEGLSSCARLERLQSDASPCGARRRRCSETLPRLCAGRRRRRRQRGWSRAGRHIRISDQRSQQR